MAGLTDDFKDLAPMLHREIAEMTQCTGDGTINIALDEVSKYTFAGGISISYGDSGSKSTQWENMVKQFEEVESSGKKPSVQVRNLIDKTKADLGPFLEKIISQDEEVMKMMRDIGTEAIKYYYMFGMVPIGVKKVYKGDYGIGISMADGTVRLPGEDDEEEADYELYIPKATDGHFVYKIIDYDEIQFHWKWTQKAPRGFGPMQDTVDRNIHVHIWSGLRPDVNCPTPFQSVIQRLRKPYIRKENEWANFSRASFLLSRPVVAVQEGGTMGSLEDLPASEQWNDQFNSGELEGSMEHQSRSRMDASFEERFTSELHRNQSKGAYQYARAIDSRSGLATYEMVDPYSSVVFQTVPGRTQLTTLPHAKVSGNTMDLEAHFRQLVSQQFRIPIGILEGHSNGKNNTKNVEILEKGMKSTVESMRGKIKDFIESSWKPLFGRAEYAIGSQKLEELRMEEQNDKGAVKSYLAYLLKYSPNDPVIPEGLTSPSQLGEDAEEEVNYRLDGREVEGLVTKYQRLATQKLQLNYKIQSLTEAVMGNAARYGKTLDRIQVEREATDMVSFWESRNAIRGEQMTRLHQVMTSYRPLKIIFSEPIDLDLADIVALEKNNFIAHEEARKLALRSKRLPIGMPKPPEKKQVVGEEEDNGVRIVSSGNASDDIKLKTDLNPKKPVKNGKKRKVLPAPKEKKNKEKEEEEEKEKEESKKKEEEKKQKTKKKKKKRAKRT